MTWQKKAKHFLTEETQFHLGFLPTEQSNPLTVTLTDDFKESALKGVKTMQKVDRAMVPIVRRVLESDDFAKMEQAAYNALKTGDHKLVFSGCGATGRLSILLQTMWKRGCRLHGKPEMAGYVEGLQTGGDYAVVKCIPSFEDFKAVGAKQVEELGLKKGDVFVAITEGGETSSVLGSLEEADRRGCVCFLMFNNPAQILKEHIVRSKEAIDNPRVTVFDLYSGQMTIAGSTRMQATSSEMMIAGAVLEKVASKLFYGKELKTDFAQQFENMLNEYESSQAVDGIANYIVQESEVYKKGGLVTYYAPDYLIDIFTDTTERTPTFMLPPFRPVGSAVGIEPWTFVKHLYLETKQAYQAVFERPPRCLTWQDSDYINMNMRQYLPAKLPDTEEEKLYQFQIGYEDMPSRRSKTPSMAVLVVANGAAAQHQDAFDKVTKEYTEKTSLDVGGKSGVFSVPLNNIEATPLELVYRVGLKIVLNTISTGAMVRVGRTRNNWMTYVSVSNKKLTDRAIRIIAELGGKTYEESCDLLFKYKEEVDAMPAVERENISMVTYVLDKIQKQ